MMVAYEYSSACLCARRWVCLADINARSDEHYYYCNILIPKIINIIILSPRKLSYLQVVICLTFSIYGLLLKITTSNNNQCKDFDYCTQQAKTGQILSDLHFKELIEAFFGIEYAATFSFSFTRYSSCSIIIWECDFSTWKEKWPEHKTLASASKSLKYHIQVTIVHYPFWLR